VEGVVKNWKKLDGFAGTASMGDSGGGNECARCEKFGKCSMEEMLVLVKGVFLLQSPTK